MTDSCGLLMSPDVSGGSHIPLPPGGTSVSSLQPPALAFTGSLHSSLFQNPTYYQRWAPDEPPESDDITGPVPPPLLLTLLCRLSPGSSYV